MKLLDMQGNEVNVEPGLHFVLEDNTFEIDGKKYGKKEVTVVRVEKYSEDREYVQRFSNEEVSDLNDEEDARRYFRYISKVELPNVKIDD